MEHPQFLLNTGPLLEQIQQGLGLHANLLLAALGLLLASAIVSGYEVAFFNLVAEENEALEGEKPENRPANRNLSFFRSRADSLMATVQFTNLFFNMGLIVLLAYVLQDFRLHLGLAHTAWFLADAALIGSVLIFFGEILPKAHADHHPQGWIRLFSLVMRLLYYLTFPISWTLGRANRAMLRTPTEADQQVTYQELRHAIEITSEESSPQEEKQILRGLVEITALPVRQVMLPWDQAVVLNLGMKLEEVVATINAQGYSRMPVLRSGNRESVVGILYVKDLLPSLGTPDAKDWQRLIRKPYYVLETKKINRLLNELKTTRQHMAIVRSEQGRTVGIITLQDILEQIFGDLEDEFDRQEVLYVREAQNQFLMDGRIPLPYLAQLLERPVTDFDTGRRPGQTLSDFLITQNGRLPVKGQVLQRSGYCFEALSVAGHTVQQVRVYPASEPKP